MAVDSTDDRLAELGHQDEQLDEKITTAVALEGAHLTVEAREVGAGAEDAARTGKDDNSHVLLRPAPAKGRREVAEHDRGQRVALFRTIEGEGGDVLFNAEQDLLEGRFFRHGT